MGTSLSITFVFLLAVFTSYSNAFGPNFKISNTFGSDDHQNQHPQLPAPPHDLLEHHDALDPQMIKPNSLESADIHSLLHNQGPPEEEPPVEEPPEEEPPSPPPPPPLPKPPKRRPPRRRPRRPPPRHVAKQKPPPGRAPCLPRCLPHRRKKSPPHIGALWPPKLQTLTLQDNSK